MKVAVISEKGRRSKMEDAYCLEECFAGKSWIFGGIYDGHNGYTAALYTSLNIGKLFFKNLSAGITVEESFINAYEIISDRLKNQSSGTTALSFLIQEKQIIFANAGDSRAIIIGHKNVQQVTVDHRIENLREQKRITAMGGQIVGSYVYRGSIGLMPTRTLGDEYFKPVGIIPTPSVCRYVFSSNDLFLIVACDGLFDVMSNQDVACITRRFTDPALLLEELRNEVFFARKGTDNMTIIAVYLR